MYKIRHEKLQSRVGKLIRKRRHELGLTLDEIADHVGASRPTISNLETGYHASNYIVLLRVVHFLGIKHSDMNNEVEKALR